MQIAITNIRLLKRNHRRSLQAFGIFFDRELDFLVFLQSAIASSLDSAEMDENVIAIFLADKAIAFRRIEPLDGSDQKFVH